jgi:hypothetical protein
MHEYRRRLYVDGHAGCIVHGDNISVQYEYGSHLLLITNHDWFEGTSHWFYWLNSSGHVVDQASTPDYFGFIQDLAVDEPDTIRFGFFGTNDKWSLLVSEPGVWSFAPAHLLRRANRFLLAKRHLSFNCIKGEPWTLPA